MSNEICIHCKRQAEEKENYFIAHGLSETTTAWLYCSSSKHYGIACSNCHNTFHSDRAPVPGSNVKCPSCNNNSFYCG